MADELLDFFANWCGPCHVMDPIVEKIATKHGLKLTKINIDSSPDLAEKYSVQSIPTIIKLVDGGVSSVAVGMQPLSKLEATLGLTTD